MTGHRGIEFDRELDAVADLGMDPTGQRPIDGAIEASVEDGTLVEFPPGEYRVEERHLLGAVERYGWRGAGEDRGDVRFTTSSGTGLTVLVVHRGRDVLVENLTFDQGDRDHCSSLGNVFVVRDGLCVRDVEYAGYNPSGVDESGEVTSLAIRVTEPDGVGVVERFVQVGPGNRDPERGTPAAIWYGNRSDSPGTLYVRDCRVENAPGPGVHASDTNGTVHVDGGRFRNNSVANVRIAGAGSSVRDATVVVDTVDAHPGDVGRHRQSRGVWVEGGHEGNPGPTIEDCELRMDSLSGHSEGLLRIDANAGETVVRDSHIHNDVAGVHTVYARTPGEWLGTPDGPHGTLLDGVDITGHGGAGQAVLFEGRDGCRLRDCRVTVESGDGVVFRDADDCAVEGTTITAPGRATVFDRATDEAGGSDPVAESGTAATALEPDGGTPTCATGTQTSTARFDLLRVESPDGEPVHYRIVVEGTGEAVTAKGRSERSTDESGRTVFDGWVADNPDRWAYDGDVAVVEFLRGEAVLYRNDDRVTPGELTGAVPTRTLTVTGDGTASTYGFTVSGTVRADTGGAEYTPPENVSGASAEGGVRDGTDSYLFTGEVTNFSLRGLATVRVDGRVVEPTRLGEPDREVLRVESLDGAPVRYRVRADAGVEPATPIHAFATEATSEGIAVDSRTEGAESWATTGVFRAFDAVEGSGRVFLNDVLVAPSDLRNRRPPNELVVAPSDDPVDVTVAVDGDLVRAPEPSNGDGTPVPGGTTHATVDGEPVTFWFSGDLRTLQVAGEASLSVSFEE